MNRSLLLFVFLTFLSTQLAAQEMPAHVKKSLDKLVGKWEFERSEGDEDLNSVSIEWAVENTAIKFSWNGTDPQTGKPGSSVGIVGWHPGKKMLVEYEIGTLGFTSEGTHHITTDESWTSPLRGTKTTKDGEVVHYEHFRTINFESADKWTVTVRGFENGKPIEQYVMTCSRSK